MDIFTNNGFYQICVRDGKQADCNISIVTSIPEKELFSILFTDTTGKSFEVWNQDNQVVQTIDLAGNPDLQMTGGLFPLWLVSIWHFGWCSGNNDSGSSEHRDTAFGAVH